jgi:CMP-N-acetylneuraminic acid synthetase
MVDGKTAIGIIPARGGSKGLPGKNIRPLCDKPLIAWTIEKALQSRHLDKVMVSTDSVEIAEIARRFGAEVPFLRPDELAGDAASSFDVVAHALEHYRQNGQIAYDYTVLLEPTSPLRADDDIDRMLEKLDANADRADGIISVGEVSEHPSIMKRLSGDRFEPFCPQLSQTTRRQDNTPAYFPYGVAYIAKTPVLLGEKTFYLSNAAWYQIERYQAYEIDDIYDFLCVESVMKHEWKIP